MRASGKNIDNNERMVGTMGHCLLIKPDEISAVKLLPEGTLAQMCEHLDCRYVDVVRLAPGIDMWVDDEGLIVADPVPNWPATFLASSYLGTSAPQLLCGTVLVTGVTRSGATINLTDEVADAVTQRLIGLLG